MNYDDDFEDYEEIKESLIHSNEYPSKLFNGNEVTPNQNKNRYNRQSDV